MDEKIKKAIQTISMNFVTNNGGNAPKAKLKVVDIKNKKFKLGNITFSQVEIPEPITWPFIENYCYLNIVEMLNDEFVEDVQVTFSDSGFLKGIIQDRGFIGIEIYNHINTILQVGIEYKDGQFEQIFRYYPHYLTSVLNQQNILIEINK
jgi:hypothetical protein